MEATQATYTNKFELAGLGQAPFRWLGVRIEKGPIDLGGGLTSGAPGQPMGTCDFCGQGIAECHQIESADGKRSIVGSSCVHKMGDKALTDKVKRESNRIKREAKAKRDNARIDATRALLAQDNVRADLAAQPHPKDFMAAKGFTLADWADWMMVNAGTKGRLEVCKLVEKIS